MIDLRAALLGDVAGDGPERPSRSDTRNAIVCDCGGGLAHTYVHEGHLWAWIGPYRHTPRGAAEVVIDAALEDFEALGEIAAQAPETDDPELSAEVAVLANFARVHSVDSLAAIVPHLTMPARARPLVGLSEWWARQVSESQARGVAPGVISGMDAGCPKCRRVSYVGTALLRATAEGRHAPRAIVATPAEVGWTPTVQHFGYAWPPERRAERVRLYGLLTAMR